MSVTETAAEPQHPVAPAAAAGPSPLGGDPTLIGVPVLVVGTVALGLAQAGFVPAAAIGAPLAILLTASGLGMLIAAVWGAALGQNAIASVFGVFAGFFISYVALVLGLLHGWYGLAPEDTTAVVKLFVISWLVTVVLLTVTTLRLPSVFTALFAMVDLALLFLLLGAVRQSAGLGKAAGFAILLVAVGSCYVYASVASVATGGKGLPLGRPVISG
jgi:succinate-acetate transporter protein